MVANLQQQAARLAAAEEAPQSLAVRLDQIVDRLLPVRDIQRLAHDLE